MSKKVHVCVCVELCCQVLYLVIKRRMFGHTAIPGLPPPSAAVSKSARRRAAKKRRDKAFNKKQEQEKLHSEFVEECGGIEQYKKLELVRLKNAAIDRFKKNKLPLVWELTDDTLVHFKSVTKNMALQEKFSETQASIVSEEVYAEISKLYKTAKKAYKSKFRPPPRKFE